VALTAAAVATSRLRVGSGICLVIERDPITTAKEVASVDHLSGGRFEFGVGAGWNREEMEHHGTPFGRRWEVLRERVLAMKALWTQEEASFHGEFVNFDRAISFPKMNRNVLLSPRSVVLTGFQSWKPGSKESPPGSGWTLARGTRSGTAVGFDPSLRWLAESTGLGGGDQGAR